MAGTANFDMEIDDLEVFQPEDSHNVQDPPQNVDLAVSGPSGLGSSGTNHYHGRAHESSDRQLTRNPQEEGSSDTEMDLGAGEDGEEDDDDVDETFDETVKELLAKIKMAEDLNRELREELRQVIEEGLEQVLGEQEE